MTATAACIWCGHTETGEGHLPWEAIRTHQVNAHGGRRMRCGCEYAAAGRRVPGAAQPERKSWWTCEEHSTAYLRQITAWILANHQAGRWADRERSRQSSLLGRTT
ncbi:MAG: hypothetical protein LCH96_14600 [Actinobacteria bacterium]|nr:hypothetical protein [Actinomycetota bacterium]